MGNTPLPHTTKPTDRGPWAFATCLPYALPSRGWQPADFVGCALRTVRRAGQAQRTRRCAARFVGVRCADQVAGQGIVLPLP
jgi:hypothetical protein